MQNFHVLMQTVLDRGEDQFNTRTGKVCKAIAGYQLQYNLADGFPAITTKKLAFKAMCGELLGFFRGYTNAADFRSLGCGIWDANANETKAWLANPYRKGVDDLGVVYGAQWTNWMDRRIATSESEMKAYVANGYKLRMTGTTEPDNEGVSQQQWLVERGINQLENALRKLITDPSDRRIIVSGWNIAEFDRMALPPCHMDYRFVAFDGQTKESPKVLHVVMTIRSWDLFLGAPFNISETALFLEIMARLAGMTPGVVTVQATNAHIYEDHYEQVNEQLARTHFVRPKLVISDRIKAVTIDEVKGAFTRIKPDDISLVNYESHAAIKAPMAA